MNTLKIILLVIIIVYVLLAMGKPINDWCDKHIFNKKKENLNKTRKEEIRLTAKKDCFNEQITMLGFIAGAEWADRTMIDNACKWLKDYAHIYVSETTGDLNEDDLINAFRQAMEGRYGIY